MWCMGKRPGCCHQPLDGIIAEAPEEGVSRHRAPQRKKKGLCLGDRGWRLLSPGGLRSFVPGRLSSVQQLEAGAAWGCLRAELYLQWHRVLTGLQGDRSSVDPAPHCRSVWARAGIARGLLAQ